ncbi:wall-associated receptor kinase-like 20 [Jatropha curcas]|uniref:wall-associated receptor kinase-like 20 n=1 Tax=Jatropha curcas TaxID=180498 RepID=UPI0009D668F9|nr:wall-associated receptor kinase-like 20 [Jatropha curcas]
MDNRQLLLTLFLTIAMLLYNRQVLANRRCPNCGQSPVPYPFSTSPACGDPLYKITCKANALWFNALNGSSYLITSINPLTQRLTIRPPGFAKNTCMAADFASQGFQLDSNLPFNITGSNTVIIMNCSQLVFEFFSALNCSSTSRCHDYVKENAVAKAACGAIPEQICCWFKTGGSLNEYKIRVRTERCSAYQSFVNLDLESPVSKWPEPGLELEWSLPQEPMCKTTADCQDLPNSLCLPDPIGVRTKRCFCLAGFMWDPINGVCEKCKHRGHCHQHKTKTPLIGGSALAVVAMLLGIIVIFLVYKKQHLHQKREKLAQVNLSKVRERILSVNSGGLMGRIFTSKEITKATNNFSRDNLLGSGGFGEVFKGIIDNGTVTAIKRAKAGNTKGIDQILNEVRILCQVNHRSLVKLLGCCVELEQPLLVYEYIPNGTLFDNLHTSNKKAHLTWTRRLVIAHQTAEGLAYLHSSATPPIYHRDVKSSNILLDQELNAKVSDFGISRLAVTDTSHITTCAQGTLGYLDPEYYINFQLTDKSDVYSFGVVLLEMLTSKKAIDFSRVDEDVNLVVYGRKILKQEKLLDAIDPVLKEGASKLELETMQALWSLAEACLDDKRQNRPSMKEVADEIEYIMSLVIADENSCINSSTIKSV